MMITKVQSGDGFTIDIYIDRFHLDKLVVDALEQLSESKYDWRTRAFVDQDGTFLTNQLGMNSTIINALVISLINTKRMNSKDTIKNLLLDKCSVKDLQDLQRDIQQKIIERI